MNKNIEYKLGTGCNIAETAVIGKGCKIGNNVTIHHYVVIYDGTEIGDNTEIFDHAVIGRQPKGAGNQISKINNNCNPVIIGENCVVGTSVVIYAGCKCGHNVMLSDMVALREECIIGNNVVLGRFVDFNHHVTVGDNSKIMDCCHITSRTVIENDVFLGVGIMSANDNNMQIKGKPVTSEIRIKPGTKIGSGAILLPDVKIGENSIVGSGSVVTKSVKEETTVMGIPARER